MSPPAHPPPNFTQNLENTFLQRVGKEVAIGEVAERRLHLLLRIHLDLLGPFPILSKPPQRISPRPGPEPPLRSQKNQMPHWWNGVFLGLEVRGGSMVSNAVPDHQLPRAIPADAVDLAGQPQRAAKDAQLCPQHGGTRDDDALVDL